MRTRAAARPRPRRSERARSAYHEAGHVVGWLSAPFRLPQMDAITIEPDVRHGYSGEVRHRAAAALDARAHQLAIGRALARGKLTALRPALAAVSAQLRAHASGPVAEAMYCRSRLGAALYDEHDYWNAYELAATAGLHPEQVWRAEVRRARSWLRRRWPEVERLARLLLARPAGKRTLAGAALRSFVARSRREVDSPYGPGCYEAAARTLLCNHRQRWRTRPHWVVMEARRPRSIAVAWAEDAPTAAAAARELTAFVPHTEFIVRKRR